ncbi:MAG: hypothetical protein Q9175_007609, partial [Cornicularia normoerica]
PYHWVNDLESDPPIESRSNIQANIEDVHRSPEDLTSQLSNSRARAEAAVKSKDVTKVRTLAPEQLRPDVIAELHNKGAFQLPVRVTCDELIDAFFHWAAPLVPVLNKIEFLRSYQDPNNQPSLLLIQAVLAAGSTVAGGSHLSVNPVAPVPVTSTYFDRARTLYEANYETDPVTLVQSLILMGWYWEALDETTKDSFYWTRVAISAARALGLHRILEPSSLTIYEKRVRKRMWWTLLARDCSITTVLGGTLSIDTTVWKESNITKICAEDFEEDVENPPNAEHVHFFLHTTITLLHRTQMYSRRHSPEEARNSSMIAFRAAGMITAIIRALASHNELTRCPGFIIYSIFSALTVHVFHIRSNDPGIAIESRSRFMYCMSALETASRTWHIARSIHSTFKAVLGKPDLEDRLQHVAERQFSH